MVAETIENAMRDYYEVIGVRRNAGAEEVRRACRRATDSDSWLDEVAIDFPSTARVFDRVRSSFLGEARADGLVAEVSLSADEADRGADVPLTLPVRSVCPSCGGRGEVWLDRCAPCAGAGELVFARQVRLQIPRGVEDGSRFRFALSADGAPATSIEVHIIVR